MEINDAGYVLRDANSHSITVIDKVRLGALIHKGWRALSGARPTTRQSFIHTTADARILQQLSSDPTKRIADVFDMIAEFDDNTGRFMT